MITISREYGSGGHDIGQRLAALLKIPFYDREIVEMTAKQFDLDAASLNDMEESPKTRLPFGLGGGFGAFAETDDRLFILQSQTVVKLAQRSCVIVGRCADFVLQNHPARYSFFIYSGLKQRLMHVKQQAGIYKTADPARELAKMDRRRAAYYKYYTGQEWGKPSNYHLSVDSGVLGPQTANVLAEFVLLGEQAKETRAHE